MELAVSCSRQSNENPGVPGHILEAGAPIGKETCSRSTPGRGTNKFKSYSRVQSP